MITHDKHTQRLYDLHPSAQKAFLEFDEAVLADPLTRNFRPFETHRTPTRQDHLKAAGTSKVGAWNSVHQYGFAADYAEFDGTKFTWPDASSTAWVRLHRIAKKFDLHAPIKWDPGHIVALNWRTTLITFIRLTYYT